MSDHLRSGCVSQEKFGGSKPRARHGATRQSSTESRTSGKRGREVSVALSQLKGLGEQAVAALAANLACNGPGVKGQLIASRFYEAIQRQLNQVTIDDTKRTALIATSD